MTARSLITIACGIALAWPSLAWAQSHDHHAQHSQPASTPSHEGSNANGAPPAVDPHAHHAMPMPVEDASKSAATDTPREPIPPVTDSDLAAAFPDLHPHAMEHAPANQFLVRVDRLEAWDADDGSGQSWELKGWYGGDVNRLWLRSEGEREGGDTHSADLALLYGRAVSPWWDVVAGVRRQFVTERSRTQLAFGVQGLAPYKFEVSATGYLSENGTVAAEFEAEYELRLTSRWILQPHVEVAWSSDEDDTTMRGRGFGNAEAALRLRYEVTRRFAPYIGIAHEQRLGDTADRWRDAGHSTQETRIVAGVRFWF